MEIPRTAQSTSATPTEGIAGHNAGGQGRPSMTGLRASNSSPRLAVTSAELRMVDGLLKRERNRPWTLRSRLLTCIAECNPAKIAEVDHILDGVQKQGVSEVELFTALCHKYQHIAHTDLLKRNLHFSIVAVQVTKFFVSSAASATAATVPHVPTGPMFNVLDALRDGTVLCMAIGLPVSGLDDATSPAKKYFAARDNVARFIDACRERLGRHFPTGAAFEGGEFHEGARDDAIAFKLGMLALALYVGGIVTKGTPPLCAVFDGPHAGLKSAFSGIDPSLQIVIIRSELPQDAKLHVEYGGEHQLRLSHAYEHPSPLSFSCCVLEGLIVVKQGASWVLVELVLAKYVQLWDGLTWTFRRPGFLRQETAASRPASRNADHRCQLVLETPIPFGSHVTPQQSGPQPAGVPPASSGAASRQRESSLMGHGAAYTHHQDRHDMPAAPPAVLLQNKTPSQLHLPAYRHEQQHHHQSHHQQHHSATANAPGVPPMFPSAPSPSILQPSATALGTGNSFPHETKGSSVGNSYPMHTHGSVAPAPSSVPMSSQPPPPPHHYRTASAGGTAQTHHPSMAADEDFGGIPMLRQNSETDELAFTLGDAGSEVAAAHASHSPSVQSPNRLNPPAPHVSVNRRQSLDSIMGRPSHGAHAGGNERSHSLSVTATNSPPPQTEHHGNVRFADPSNMSNLSNLSPPQGGVLAVPQRSNSGLARRLPPAAHGAPSPDGLVLSRVQPLSTTAAAAGVHHPVANHSWQLPSAMSTPRAAGTRGEALPAGSTLAPEATQAVARGPMGSLRAISRTSMTNHHSGSGSPSPSSRTPRRDRDTDRVTEEPTQLHRRGTSLPAVPSVSQFDPHENSSFVSVGLDTQPSPITPGGCGVVHIEGDDDFDGVDSPLKMLEFAIRANGSSEPNKTFRIAPSDERSVIGRGAFGSVFHGIELATLRSVAVKVIPFTNDSFYSPPAAHIVPNGAGGTLDGSPSSSTFEGLMRQATEAGEQVTAVAEEADVLATIDHPNVVRCYGATVLDGRCLCLVLEYASGGTLKNLVERFSPVPDAVATRVVKEMVSALVAVHAAGLVHCDLKLENVLLRDDGSVAIADFGCARASCVGEEGSLVGTPQYMSPESISDPKAAFDPKRDIWALGCCAVTLFTGAMPWAHEQFESKIPLMFHVGNSSPETLPFTPDVIQQLPPVIRSVVLDCFCHDLARRPSAVKLLPLLDL